MGTVNANHASAAAPRQALGRERRERIAYFRSPSPCRLKSVRCGEENVNSRRISKSETLRYLASPTLVLPKWYFCSIGEARPKRQNTRGRKPNVRSPHFRAFRRHADPVCGVLLARQHAGSCRAAGFWAFAHCGIELR